MTNKEIAKTFQELGNIMELHQENPFKIRSYQNAYIQLRKLDRPLTELSEDERSALKGIGKAISAKIGELLETGQLETLEKYRAATPEGVREMLQIKGFGPKKIRVLWKELGAESIGELLYAVNENRLIELKGFGEKTQEDLKQKLEYYQKSKGLFHYAALEGEARALLEALQQHLPDVRMEWTGPLRRHAITLQQIELLVAETPQLKAGLEQLELTINREEAERLEGTTANGLPVTIHQCAPENFGSKQFKYSGARPFLEAFVERFPGQDFTGQAEEAAIFEQVGLPYILPELRESEDVLELAAANQLPELVQATQLKGVLHAHSTYSDGIHSLEEMAQAAKALGYEYLGITDHSKAAFYANGLQPERVWQQFEEIDHLNQRLAPFRIFKGIESDILNDGSLDYEDDLLAAFDFIIASVHTNLRMDEEKATERIIRAVENPYTTILGHPTGRLLLSRKGYPLDHIKVIDACAANQVAIELNANPYRLDLDWTWIPYAIEKGVPISINPDAHSREGIRDIHFGLLAARKGRLQAADCLNTKTAAEFEQYCKLKKY
ncbi:MAG: PHP domain-containing protein [Phaeodactylibacter sp.]|nr:PHP domain-containing protein [Phaeodactylibacter sp.]